MKKFFILLFSFQVLVFGQWAWQMPTPQGNSLTSIVSLNSSTVIAVGSTGMILKSTDSGMNWNVIPSCSYNTFNSVSFCNEQTGWAVGSNGTILKTTDGGLHWINQSFSTNYFYGVKCVSNEVGFACGESGYLVKTADGGNSWINISISTTSSMRSLFFSDVNNGIVVGGSKIYKTTNGGVSWTTTSVAQPLLSVFFINSSTGYIAGSNGYIIKTTNGGGNWSALTTNTTEKFSSIFFYDINTGWATTENGKIIKTTDGGTTWNLFSTPITTNLYSVVFLSLNNGLAVGYHGIILKTTNGGSTYTSLVNTFNYGLNDIAFLNSTFGLAVSDNGLIYKTTNGGANWGQVASGVLHELHSVFIINSTTAWVCGYGGIILKTTNSGNNWTQLTSGTTNYLNAIYFISDQTGWVVGNGGTIMKTTNGGSNWTAQTSPTTKGLYSMEMFDNNTGWIAGSDGTILKTTNGGTNWNQLTTGVTDDFTGINFSDANFGVAVGFLGKAIRTTNGGTSWNIISTNTEHNLYSIEFLDVDTGWIVGDFGLILKTTNSGKSWFRQYSYYGENLRGLSIYDANNIWCCGYFGAILKNNENNSGSISITRPAGGEKWLIGSEQTIVWTQTSLSNVKIEYTTDNGGSWNLIATNPALRIDNYNPNQILGSFTWVVPNTPSDLCRIKISSISSPQVYALSNSQFKIVALQNPTWSVDLKIKDNTSPENIISFGLAPNATNAIDVEFGENELPPVPPTGTFDTRFELPVNPILYSVKDFRNDTSTYAKWKVLIQPGAGGYPFTIKWNKSSLPPGDLFLKDGITGTLVHVNMKADSQCVISNSNIGVLSIEYYSQLCLNIQLLQGWNMLAVPVVASSMNAQALFPTATSSFYSYNNGYNTVTTLENVKGYWAKFNSAFTQSVCGSSYIPNTIPVNAGWNMIGVKERDIAISNITSIPPGIINSSFYEYNNGYVNVTTLKYGKGYWVKVTQNGTLNLPTTVLAKTRDNENETMGLCDFETKILITDNSGNTQTLYLTKDQIDLTRYELPPQAPQGIADIRFGSDGQVENLNQEQIIKMNSLEYPVKIKVIGMDISLKDNIEGKLINKTLKDGEEIIITNPQINTIKIKTIEIPTEYSLSQNYPNPFNPTTKIKFSVPNSGFVTLKVLNILGEKIDILVQDHLPAGVYQVEWKAKDLPSGVYLYSLQAGKFSQIKKAILLR